MSLALLKTEVLSVLADAYDETSWSDGSLEEALRQALLFFHPHAIVREETFTLLDSGYEHDLTTLGAHEIISIGWPWSDGYCLSQVARHWRKVGQHTIRMDDLSLDTGDDIRVEYRPRHTILHLDAATETTFWEIEQRRFVLAAAHFALLARSRYYAHAGTAEQRERIPAILVAAEGLMRQFLDFQSFQSSSSYYVTWGAMGQ